MGYIDKLVKLRKERGYTQADIANVLNTSTQYYQKYEKGKHPLPIDHLMKLCDFYGVSAECFLKENDAPYYKEFTLDENQKALKALQYIENLKFISYTDFLKQTMTSGDYIWLRDYLGGLQVYLIVCEIIGTEPNMETVMELEETEE